MSGKVIAVVLALLAALGWQSVSGTPVPKGREMPSVWVRYIVNDVDASIPFYTAYLGFKVDMHPAPGFAALSRGQLQLLLNVPGGSGGAAQAMPDGRVPVPGGWNRVQLRVEDLAHKVDAMRKAGLHFRNNIVDGNGGRQILLEDPSGNLIELFEPYPR